MKLNNTIESLLYKWAITPVTKNVPLFLFYIVSLILPALIFVENGENGPRCILLLDKFNIIYLLVTAFVYSIILTLLSGYSRYLRVICLTLTSILVFVEGFTYLYQYTRLNFNIIELCLQSNPTEACEFVTTPNLIDAVVPSMLIAIGLIVLCLIMQYFWSKSVALRNLFERCDHSKAFRITSLICMGFAIILSIIGNIYIWKKCFSNMVTDNAFSVICCAPIYHLNDVRRLSQMREQYNTEDIYNANANITIQDSGFDSLKIVYIIGESHNRHRSFTYGYFLETDSAINALCCDSSMLAFTDVVTPFNHTKDSYPRLLSTSEVGANKVYSKYPLTAAVFKKAGFKTYMFNNQSSTGSFSADMSCDFMFFDKNIRKQCFDSINTMTQKYDLDFLQIYKPSMSGKTFTTYHLMGQHTPCNERYKGNDSKFSPSNYSFIKEYSQEECIEMAHYDNATASVDKFIMTVVSQLKQDYAVVVYVPDHGETVYDTDHSIGRQINYTKHVIKNQFEVPLFIWASDTYRRRHPEIWCKLKQNISKPIYNSDIAHTLIELAGIKTNACNSNLSLLTSNVYRTKRKITRNMDIDYESIRPICDSITSFYPGRK